MTNYVVLLRLLGGDSKKEIANTFTPYIVLLHVIVRLLNEGSLDDDVIETKSRSPSGLTLDLDLEYLSTADVAETRRNNSGSKKKN